MALTPTPQILQFSLKSPSNSAPCLLLSDLTNSHSPRSPSPWPPLQIALHRSRAGPSPVSPRVKCMARPTEEDRWSESENTSSDSDNVAGPDKAESHQNSANTAGARRTSTASYSDSLSLGIREPVYEVVEVKSNGLVSTRKINRRQLLKSSGLRPRDIRSIDPLLWLTNSMPSLLVREHAILLNLGSLRAIAMAENAWRESLYRLSVTSSES